MKVRELIELFQAVDPDLEVEFVDGIDVNQQTGRVEIRDEGIVERTSLYVSLHSDEVPAEVQYPRIARQNLD